MQLVTYLLASNTKKECRSNVIWVCHYIYEGWMIVCDNVNGLHQAQAPTYYCTIVSIYDMTITTHSVMCHIHIWNIILYLILELLFTYFGNTHEHTMLRIRLSVFYAVLLHGPWYIKVLYGSHIYTDIFTLQIMSTILDIKISGNLYSCRMRNIAGAIRIHYFQ